MKLSDYVASFIAAQGIRHVFAVNGGASLHLIDSLSKTPGTGYICPQHEQAGAMAADGYARMREDLGAAIATSGPGATNMITGVCCAYCDSVPVLYITGQVATFRLKRDTGVRQMGFQETETVPMYKPCTKYAVMVEDPKRIRYELEKACHIARSGRPGPVLVDIPDNLQREQIEPDELESFVPEPEHIDHAALNTQVDDCIRLLKNATRPVIIAGCGIRRAGGDEAAWKLFDRLGIPIIPTWAMVDFIPTDNPLLVGTFGTHGTRFANFTVQNCDFLLAIGTRLDTHEAGSPFSSFAREARKVMVDVDSSELDKFKTFGMDIDVPIHCDAGVFLDAINERLGDYKAPDYADWKARIVDWKTRYSVHRPEYEQEKEVNPYCFVKALSGASAEGEIIFIDTGCAIAWMMQGFESKKDQRLIHDFNNTAMGYALPGAIGASLALDGKQVVCVTGDGSLQMNIQELATLLRHNLPIKIFLLNNHGYSMIQQTQEQWLNARYEATTIEGGLAFPDFVKVAEAYGFKTYNLAANKDLRPIINEVMALDGPVFCNVEILATHRVIPQVRFGRPIEDPEPFLPREEFLAQMIVKPLEASLT